MTLISNFKAAKTFFAAFFISTIFSFQALAVESGYTQISLKFFSLTLPNVVPKTMQVTLVYEPERRIPFLNGRHKASSFAATLPGLASGRSGEWVPKQIKVNFEGKALAIHEDQLLISAKTGLFGISSYRLKALEFTSDLISKTYYYKDKAADEKTMTVGYSSPIKAGEAPSPLAALYAAVESDELSFDYFYENRATNIRYVDCEVSLCRFKEQLYSSEAVVESLFQVIDAPENASKEELSLVQGRKIAAVGSFFKAPFTFKECSAALYQVRRARAIVVSCVNKDASGYQKQEAKIKYFLFDDHLISVSRYFLGSMAKSSSEYIYWWNDQLVQWSLDQDLVGKSKSSWNAHSGTKKNVDVGPFLAEALRYWRL